MGHGSTLTEQVDTSAEHSVEADMTVAGIRTRKRRSIQEKLQIVRETLQSEASVAVIARRHGIIDCRINNAIFNTKKGQLRLRHTAAQGCLRGTCFAQALEQRATEVVDVIGSAVSQWVFDGVPGGFDGLSWGA